MQEFDALLELLAMLIKEPRIAVLFILLVMASISDYRTFKIPNWLTVGGIVFALGYNTIVPFSRQQGLLWALGGLTIGFLSMLPAYVLRIMGAGDVKLMAMVGAFLGVTDAWHAVIFSFIAGGVCAVMFAVFNKSFTRMLGNVKNMTQVMVYSAMGGVKPYVQIESSQSVGKLPYGVCISIGTITYIVSKQLGYV